MRDGAGIVLQYTSGGFRTVFGSGLVTGGLTALLLNLLLPSATTDER